MTRFLNKEIVRTFKVTDCLSIQLLEIPKRKRVDFSECSYCGEGDFWNETWPTGLALSKYLATRFPYERLNGRRALVIGSGVGLEGIVLDRLGAIVSFLDHIPDALRLVYRNCLLNKIESFETICCCWRNSEGVQNISKYDLLIGGDVLYNRTDMIWIKRLLSSTLKTGGIALFADPARPGVMAFFRLLAKSNFIVKWHWADPRSNSKNQRIRVYSVERS
jgi:predicted nicotinamide N-methyase